MYQNIRCRCNGQNSIKKQELRQMIRIEINALNLRIDQKLIKMFNKEHHSTSRTATNHSMNKKHAC